MLRARHGYVLEEYFLDRVSRELIPHRSWFPRRLARQMGRDLEAKGWSRYP